MDSQDGKIIVSRHGKKFSGQHGLNIGEGGIPRPSPASPEDKAFIYITPEGAQELREKGREVLGDTPFDSALFMTSDYIRALQSALYFTEDANLLNGREIDQRKEIGMGYDGANMNHQKIIPHYEVNQDEFVRNLYRDHFFKPQEEGLPFMGEWTRQFIKSIADGIEYLQQNRGHEQSLLAHFTHAPNIDGLAMIALECLGIDPIKEIVEVDDDYKAVRMGEMFTGNIYNLDSENPSMDLNVKEEVKGYNLSDLRRIEKDIAYKIAA
ncbi:hypothetical protein CEE44_04710 [Candidatus Woesearchaeota archaeon B3_Woes]|nr:MAG: hypothetical protein CEE44_04710 [Candidatus Woesearchaeota archaeon B3_Woes]